MKSNPEVASVGSILAYRYANFQLIHRAIIRMQKAVMSSFVNLKVLIASQAGVSGKH
jgi:hypothetical protein